MSSIGSFDAQFVIVVLGFCYRSRCKHVNLCFGLVEVERDTQNEVLSDVAILNTGGSVGISGPLSEV